MDNLVLIRVAASLDAQLRSAVLEEVRSEELHRYRLAFRSGERRRSVLVSLQPELPWIASPAVRHKGKPARRGDAFAATAARSLTGTVVAGVDKPTADRVLVIRFSDGHALVVELATHGANLVLLESGGTVVASARNPRASRDRIAPGREWRSRPLPPRQLDPFAADTSAVRKALEDAIDEGEPLLEAIRRRLFGVGTEAARLVADESRGRTGAAAEILKARLGQLQRGELDPVIRSPDDPVDLARRGRLDPGGVRLLPWDPGGPLDSIRGRDPAATAGLYHEAMELAASIDRRVEGLRAILAKEVRRLWEVERRVTEDLRGFEDPARHRRWAEALLAGLGRAERHGEHAMVPDPWEPDSTVIVPAAPGLSLTEVADAHFRRHRRAQRGLESARRRIELVQGRRQRLERLQVETEEAAGERGVERLEEGMRDEGIPVGLMPRRRSHGPRARVEGVRMFTSADGASILVGRTGRDNDRLTFKIAGPEDFWLHVQGRPGAHVIIRNPRRLRSPSRNSLEEAAALAAWFSGARSEGRVDVHWTRRKYVRRIRGAPSGTVTLKRFEIVRVRPQAPPSDERPS